MCSDADFHRFHLQVTLSSNDLNNALFFTDKSQKSTNARPNLAISTRTLKVCELSVEISQNSTELRIAPNYDCKTMKIFKFVCSIK